MSGTASRTPDAATVWVDGVPRPSLSADDIHIIQVDTRPFDSRPLPLELLDETERERAFRFVFERDRQRFVAAHAALRVILGGCLDVEPGALRFAAGAHGKPELAEPRTALQFNLSHAGDFALIALSATRQVGVDIEQLRPVDVPKLSARFFSRPEIDGLKMLQPESALAAFFRCWTRKESFIKASGDGFSFPLDRFSVGLDDQIGEISLLCDNAPVDDRWTMLSLPAPAGYAAAVTFGAGMWRLRLWAPCDLWTTAARGAAGERS